MEVEEATFRAFLRPGRAERYVSLARKSRKRKLRENLYQVGAAIDERYVLVVGPADANASAICRLLRQCGAPATCHVISADDSRLDGHERDLEDALAEVVNFSQAAIISCIPGKLAYFEGDWSTHWILRRTR